LNIEGNSSSITLNKYKKLPAISNQDIQSSAIGELLARLFSYIITNRDVETNQMPAPSVYFVGITAHSHLVEEFREVYGRYDNFYRKKRAGFSNVENNVRLISEAL
jgi:hypothetical protein